jgi:hypothetical protein
VWVVIVPDERIESLIRALLLCFEHGGGVPLRVVFDNPTTVVLGARRARQTPLEPNTRPGCDRLRLHDRILRSKKPGTEGFCGESGRLGKTGILSGPYLRRSGARSAWRPARTLRITVTVLLRRRGCVHRVPTAAPRRARSPAGRRRAGDPQPALWSEAPTSATVLNTGDALHPVALWQISLISLCNSSRFVPCLEHNTFHTCACRGDGEAKSRKGTKRQSPYAALLTGVEQ